MITITNIDTSSVILKGGEFQDDTLTFASGGTILEGTILARDSISKLLIPYVKGGATNEDGIPKAILTYDATLAAPGDLPIRDMVSGTVRREKLIIFADGDASNIDADVLDELRVYTLVAIDSVELGLLDNQ